MAGGTLGSGNAKTRDIQSFASADFDGADRSLVPEFDGSEYAVKSDAHLDATVCASSDACNVVNSGEQLTSIATGGTTKH